MIELAQDNLIDIFLFNPCNESFNPITNKDIAISELKKQKESLKQQYFLWTRDRLRYSTKKIISLALKKGNSDIFYSVYETTKVSKAFTIQYCAIAAEYNRSRELYFMLGQLHDVAMCYYLNIACRAAKGGNRLILNDMIKRGVQRWSQLATYAAEGGHFDIVKEMMERGDSDHDQIAAAAAEGGHIEILNAMINEGADDWNLIAYRAAGGNNKEIVDDMIFRGANNLNYIAMGAVEENRIDLFLYIDEKCEIDYNTVAECGYDQFLTIAIERGATNWQQIAEGAAENGNRELLTRMITNGADNWDNIAEAALRGGYKDIVFDMISRGARNEVYDLTLN